VWITDGVRCAHKIRSSTELIVADMIGMETLAWLSVGRRRLYAGWH
jgi:hypothetical protein